MKVSIVTVCRNAEATISAALASVAAQDWPDLEHIVIDGVSTDATLQVIEKQRHQRLKVISEADGGIYDAMNKGLALATGDIIAFLNADDAYARPDAVSKVVMRARESGCDFIFGNTQFVQPGGEKARRVYSAVNFRRWWLRVGVMAPHPSTFARRTMLLDAGGFDPKFKIAADFDLMARVLLRDRASFAVLPLVLTNFAVGGKSTGGWAARAQITRDTEASLAAMGYRFPWLSARIRLPFKALQLLRRRRHSPSPVEQAAR